MYSYGDYETNYQRRFPPWDTLFCFVFYHKITLFKKKYDIKLITSISMYHLKPLVSLGRFIIKNCNPNTHIALRTDTVQTLCITIFHRIIL